MSSPEFAEDAAAAAAWDDVDGTEVDGVWADATADVDGVDVEAEACFDVVGVLAAWAAAAIAAIDATLAVDEEDAAVEVVGIP